MEFYTPVIVALIGAFQVALAIYFGRRNNEATAAKDESLGVHAIGMSYSTLVATLEIRLERLSKSYDELCEEYEADKIAWKLEREEFTKRLDDLENFNGK